MVRNPSIVLPCVPKGLRVGPADSSPAPLVRAAATVEPDARAKVIDSTAAQQAQRQMIAQAAEALQVAAAQLREARSEILARAQTQLLDLAIDLARKAMMQEIQAGRHQIEPLLKEALQRVPSRQDVVVYLNPDDLAKCPMAQGDEQTRNVGLRFVADSMVRSGQCLVETARGAVISSYEDRLDDLADAMKSPEQT